LEKPPVLVFPDADLRIIEPSHPYLAVKGWQCHETIAVNVHLRKNQGRGSSWSTGQQPSFGCAALLASS